MAKETDPFTLFYLNGDTYNGGWVENKKEGFGLMIFADGHNYMVAH